MYKIIFASLFSLSLMSASLDIKENDNLILLIGTNGSGKAFVGNYLHDDSNKFFECRGYKSEITMTKPKDFILKNGWKVVKVPPLLGFDEIEPWQIAKKILTASRGKYKLFFVTPVIGGRIDSANIEIIRSVLLAIEEKVPYYIIMNCTKFPKDEIGNYQLGYTGRLFKDINDSYSYRSIIREPKGVFFVPDLSRVTSEYDHTFDSNQFVTWVDEAQSGEIGGEILEFTPQLYQHKPAPPIRVKFKPTIESCAPPPPCTLL